jgi:NADH-quinone oxidoreductase subunit G
LTAQNLEPRLSPFDPFAILDEIQRLVPGYKDVLRLQLLSGNDQHLETAATALDAAKKDLVLPSGDTLFTSGTLGHYSPMLLDLQENESRKSLDAGVGAGQVAAD